MKKYELNMASATYGGVTTIPHFPTSVAYHGCHITFDDIYFDRLDDMPSELLALERTRKGSVVLDGGSRLQIAIKTDFSGGLDLSFRAEPSDFPGKLIMEGSFHIDGEHTADVIGRLIKLLVDGESFHIEQGDPS